MLPISHNHSHNSACSGSQLSSGVITLIRAFHAALWVSQ
jgi:hypothetical protein